MAELQVAGILDYPITYRGLELNDQRNVDGTLDPTKTKDCYLVERFDFSRIEFRSQRDGLHLLIGGDLGVVSSEFRYVSLVGTIAAATAAALEDKVAALLAAWNPENAMFASPTTRGVSAIDFWTPSASPPSGLTSPLHELLSGRPTSVPAIYERRGQGLTVLFSAELICPDIRRYLYAAESKVANSGNSFTIALPNWTAAVGSSVTPLITLALTGAGATNCTLRMAGAPNIDLVLNLSGIGAGAHTVVVDMALSRITLDGAEAANLRTSGVDTFWRLPAGGATFSVINTTLLTSATVAYRQART